MSDLIKIAGVGDYECPEPEEPTVPVVPDAVVKILFDGSSLDEIIYSSDDVDEGVVNKYVTSGNVQDVGGVLGSTPNVSNYEWVLHEEDLGTSSDTQVPTQGSVKAYVDSQVVVAAGVSSVNSVPAVDGDITLDTDDISEGSSNLYVTEPTMKAVGAATTSTASVASHAWVLDEDTMSSDSATQVPTQQSVKAYVDSQVISSGGISSVNEITGVDGDITIDTDDISEGSSNLYVTEANLQSVGGVTSGTLGTSGFKWIKDEDAMTSDSDVHVPTQQSVKAYVDSQVISSGGISSVNEITGVDGDITVTSDDIDDSGSTNKYATQAQLDKLDDIAASAEVNVQADWDQVDSGFDDYIQNKPTALSDFSNDMGFLTASLVSSVNSKTGVVVLDADDIDDSSTSHKFVNQSLLNKVNYITVSQAVDLDTMESDIATNSAKTALSDFTDDIDNVVSGDNISVLTNDEGYLTAYAVSSVNSQTGAVVLDADDIDDTSTSHKFATSAQLTKVGYLTVTQAVDLDTMESDVATNNAKISYPGTDSTKVNFITVTQAVDLDTMESDIATNNAKISYTEAAAVASNTAKVTNATHTGDVTGDTALTIGNDKVLTVHILDENVTNAKLADMAQDTIKGNDAAAGVPKDLTATEVRSLINVENGATADQTDAEIRTAVEAATDSNVFTDADHTNLNNQSGTNTGDEVAATEATAGVVELATASEAEGLTDGTRALTASSIGELMKRLPKAICTFVPGATPTESAGNFNVSSVVQVSTGIYTINFTNAIGVTDYNVTLGYHDSAAGIYVLVVGTQTSSSLTFRIRNGSSGALTDNPEHVHVVVYDNS